MCVCASLICSGWSAPGQGLISTLPSCSFIPLFIPYLLTSMTLRRSFLLLLVASVLSPALLTRSSSTAQPLTLLLLFLRTLPGHSLSLSDPSVRPSTSLRLSPCYSPSLSLFPSEGNLRYPSADVKPCTAPLGSRLC